MACIEHNNLQHDLSVSMKDETNLTITNTQLVSCSVGRPSSEAGYQSLRARLESERAARRQRLQDSFISTLRNLFQLT
jgi:hypothetical protein